ncbi:MAG: glycosyltransferase family 4 protein [Pseudomonadota bacterium]
MDVFARITASERPESAAHTKTWRQVFRRAPRTFEDTKDVVLVSAYFYPEPAGSAPPITDLARFISEKKLKAQVITARPSYPARTAFKDYRAGEHDSEDWRGIAVERLPSLILKSTSIPARLAAELSFAMSVLAARLKGRISDAQSVISVCPSVLTVLSAAMVTKRGARHVAIVHDIQSGLARSAYGAKGVAAMLKWLERVCLNRADAIVTLTPAMRDALIANGVKRPIHVIPPQIDTHNIVPRPEPKGHFTLIYSGALGRKQGLDQLLDLAQALKATHTEAQLIIRGEGGDEVYLRKTIEQRSLHNVRLEALVPNSKLCEAYGEGHVHLVPQNAAGADFAVPSKLFSIMSAGRPFIATALPGSPLDQIAQQSSGGLVVPPHDTGAFVSAVQTLQQDAALRAKLGQAGRRYAETHLDRRILCPRILDVALPERRL